MKVETKYAIISIQPMKDSYKVFCDSRDNSLIKKEIVFTVFYKTLSRELGEDKFVDDELDLRSIFITADQLVNGVTSIDDLIYEESDGDEMFQRNVDLFINDGSIEEDKDEDYIIWLKFIIINNNEIPFLTKERAVEKGIIDICFEPLRGKINNASDKKEREKLFEIGNQKVKELTSKTKLL